MILFVVEDRRRGSDRGAEARLVDDDAVTPAEARVAFALKRRPRVDEGEVDVEEEGPDRNAQARAPSNGPATTMAARDVSSARRAAACTWSSVTVRSRSGTRRS